MSGPENSKITDIEMTTTGDDSTFAITEEVDINTILVSAGFILATYTSKYNIKLNSAVMYVLRHCLVLYRILR